MKIFGRQVYQTEFSETLLVTATCTIDILPCSVSMYVHIFMHKSHHLIISFNEYLLLDKKPFNFKQGKLTMNENIFSYLFSQKL